MSFQSEYRLIRMRPRVSALGWPTLILTGCAFALGALANRLPETWMLNALYAAVGSIALIFWLFPLIRYVSTYLEVTSTRLIVRRGVFGQHSFEVNLGDVVAVNVAGRGRITIKTVSGEEHTVGPISRAKFIAGELAKLTKTNVTEIA